jgi:hypothetical protein
MVNVSNPRAEFVMTSEHPPLMPPAGKPLIVIVNTEYWAYDQPAPRTIVSSRNAGTVAIFESTRFVRSRSPNHGVDAHFDFVSHSAGLEQVALFP